MIPFFAEELSNINVLRASISVDPHINVAESLLVEDNTIRLKNEIVADLSTVQVGISTDNLVVAQPTSNVVSADKLTPWEIKFTLAKSPKSLHSQQAEVKDWWTSKTLLDGQTTKKVTLCCPHCSSSVVDDTVDFKIKDLPSEHWYELVECWICHETKPEEHQARMRPILARPNLLLVGTTYFLIHPDNLVKNAVQQDPIISARTNVSNSLLFIHFLYTDFKKVDDALDIIINRYKNPRLIGIQQFDRRKIYFLYSFGSF